jgi:hypothetical protein
MKKKSLKMILSGEEPPCNIVIERMGAREIVARRLNTTLNLDASEEEFLSYISNKFGQGNFIVPFEVISSGGDITLKDPSSFVYDPLKMFFLQSYGILNNYPVTSYMPSIGIWKLAYSLMAELPFVDAQVVDPNLLTKSEIKDLIKSSNPRIIGYSVIPVNLENDLRLIMEIYQQSPSSLVVVGGIQSQALRLVGLVESTPVDVVIPGSGRPELPNLLRMVRDGRIKSKQDLRSLEDKVLSDTNDSQVAQSNSHRYTNLELNELIPLNFPDAVHPKSYEAMNRQSGIKLPFAFRVTNNCSGNCYWCAVPNKEPILYENPDEVFHMVESARKNGERVIVLNDNDMGDHIEFLIRLFDQIRESGLDIEIHGKARVETINDRLLAAFAGAGGVRIAYGVESFHPLVRNRLKAHSSDIDGVERVLGKTLDQGIVPEINLIWFNHEDTRESLACTSKKSLYWLEKGAWVYSTHGLYASLGAPATKALIESGHLGERVDVHAIFIDGMTKPITMPHQYKAKQDVLEIRSQVESSKDRLMVELRDSLKMKLPIHVEGMLTPHLVADVLGIQRLDYRMLCEQARNLMTRDYVSI